MSQALRAIGVRPFDFPAMAALEQARMAEFLERTIVQAPRSGMTPAGMIQPGMEVRGRDGSWATVREVQRAATGRLYVSCLDGPTYLTQPATDSHVRVPTALPSDPEGVKG